MKRIACFIMFSLLFFSAYSQISVENKVEREVIWSFAGKQIRIERQFEETDTIYVLHLSTLSSSNSLIGQMLEGEVSGIDIILGLKEEALVLLKSMDDYDKPGDAIISLNNPSRNTAQLRRGLGSKFYLIYDANKRQGESFNKNLIPKMIKVIAADK